MTLDGLGVGKLFQIGCLEGEKIPYERSINVLGRVSQEVLPTRKLQVYRNIYYL